MQEKLKAISDLCVQQKMDYARELSNTYCLEAIVTAQVVNCQG